MPLLFLLGALATALISGAVFYTLKTRKEEFPPSREPEKASREPTSEAFEEANRLISEAERKSKEIVSEAEEKARKTRAEVLEIEERLSRRESLLEQRARALEEREEQLSKKEVELRKEKGRLDAELERRAGLTRKEAERKLLESLREDLVSKRARFIKEAEEAAKLEADEKARDILVSAMERAATDYVSEATVSRVQLPNEEMKGRVIGREGRNIKALEKATGVDFEIDETPQEVRISSFDPLRREIARRVLERLVANGRIQPARIEEEVSRVKRDLEREIRKFGRDLAYKAGISGLPVGILDLLGRLKFRTSYGQNQAEHTLEVVNLARALAREVGAREDLAAKAALLHDIGKVKTVEEGKGSHVEIGRRILKRFGFDEELIHTAMAHHRDEEFRNIEAALVYIADAISGSRPGARFEDYETYLERVEQLENIAKSFPGVREAFAISAGREVRVLVNPGEISDEEAVVLAHDIAARIEKEATYPGTVKVNVIREVRASEVAE